jgi:hypothetical protein
MAQCISHKATLLLPATFTFTVWPQFFVVPCHCHSLSQFHYTSHKGSLGISSLNCTELRSQLSGTCSCQCNRGIAWRHFPLEWDRKTEVTFLTNKQNIQDYTMYNLCVCMAPEQCIVFCNIACPKSQIFGARSATFKSQYVGYWSAKC